MIIFILIILIIAIICFVDNKIALNKVKKHIKIGQEWIEREDNPFVKKERIEILDLEEGVNDLYVLYRVKSSGETHSCNFKKFVERFYNV